MTTHYWTISVTITDVRVGVNTVIGSHNENLGRFEHVDDVANALLLRPDPFKCMVSLWEPSEIASGQGVLAGMIRGDEWLVGIRSRADQLARDYKPMKGLTVSQLIAKLQEMPQDLPVYCYGYNGEDSCQVEHVSRHPVEINVKGEIRGQLNDGRILYDYKRVSVEAVVLYED